MQSHEYFHEQAHLERSHEFKRMALLLAMGLFMFSLYCLFCRSQELEADRIAAKKCGKTAAIESLKLLQMREGKRGFLSGLLSLHPRTEKRIEKLK